MTDRPRPERPASRRDQVASTPQASGVSIPRPVTATRRMRIPSLPVAAASGARRRTARGVGRSQAADFSLMNFTASPKVWMLSAASSGISIPNSSSKAMTSSTVSRLSAPRSSMKLALS